MELSFDTVLYSNLGNENSDVVNTKCSFTQAAQWPTGHRFPTLPLKQWLNHNQSSDRSKYTT